ncbi:MAG: archease [Acidobacteria bacterium]|nr:archease [Acidobacteriota bacterium]
MPYQFLEDIAIADIAFEAWGDTLEDAFIAAADATINVMVENLESIVPRETREFMLENESLDMLLFDLLQELLYYKDSERLMLRVEKLRIQQKNSLHSLQAIARGELLDPDRHHTRVDVKAVTLHRFRLAKTERGWEASVILDI